MNLRVVDLKCLAALRQKRQLREPSTGLEAKSMEPSLNYDIFGPISIAKGDTSFGWMDQTKHFVQCSTVPT